jgi:hypothetical protein
MKRNATRTYTATVSCKLTPAEAQRLCEIAAKGRRTVSQTLRIMLEPVLKTPEQPA